MEDDFRQLSSGQAIAGQCRRPLKESGRKADNVFNPIRMILSGNVNEEQRARTGRENCTKNILASRYSRKS